MRCMPVWYGPSPLQQPCPSRIHNMTRPGCDLAHLCKISSMCEHKWMQPRALCSATGSMPRTARSVPFSGRHANLKREHEHEHEHEH